MGEAREAGRRLAGYRGRKQRYRPLLGVPVLVKDVIDATPMPAAAGPASLADLLPAVGAPLVMQLRAEGPSTPAMPSGPRSEFFMLPPPGARNGLPGALGPPGGRRTGSPAGHCPHSYLLSCCESWFAPLASGRLTACSSGLGRLRRRSGLGSWQRARPGPVWRAAVPDAFVMSGGGHRCAGHTSARASVVRRAGGRRLPARSYWLMGG